MQAEQIDTVRRFARTVTQRVGALDDRYLARDRPLGVARVLWEIGPDGLEVGALRARLGLDPGQLSRTLRSVERDGLVRLDSHDDDGRVRIARLTRAGRTEWQALEAGSVAGAQSLLAPLEPGQQDRLVAAMAEVERLLLVSMIEVSQREAADLQLKACLRAYTDELEARFGARFAPGRDDRPQRVLVATLRGEPVGTGAVAGDPGDGAVEIKRLWTAPTVRGLGLGRRLLGELERIARDEGASAVRLDSNDTLVEALALYRSAGYEEIGRYNDNPHARHWFVKRLR